MKRYLAPLIALPLILAACSEQTKPQDAPANEGPVISYTDAFVMAPIAGRDVTMGGIEISVSGGDVHLMGATSPIATSVETHTMAMDGDTMRMRPVEGWQIADGETLDLDRGKDHLMIFGLTETIAPGDTVNITLSFHVEGREEPLMLEAEAEVRGRGQ
ncbi:MAG: copper chaperone PCu(A)C [Henriciella sp.]